MRINLFMKQDQDRLNAVWTIIQAYRVNLEVDGEVADGQHLFSFTTEDPDVIANSLAYFQTQADITRIEFLKEELLVNKSYYRAAASSNPKVSYVAIVDALHYFYNLSDGTFWIFSYGNYRTTFCPGEMFNWRGLDQCSVEVMNLWRNRETVVQKPTS